MKNIQQRLLQLSAKINIAVKEYMNLMMPYQPLKAQKEFYRRRQHLCTGC
jgi:hypothetical protein